MLVVDRVSVVGVSGSGKTRLAARIAETLGVPLVELDAVHHLPGWEPIDPTVFVETVRRFAAAERWVIDGNYRAVVSDGPVWQRADTVVWLDLPRRTVMRQIVQRSIWRVLARRRLWNDNRETVRNLLAWDTQKSIIRWSWTRYRTFQQRYEAAMTNTQLGHLCFVRLRNRHDADAFVERLRS
jgi:adenylate kinase family enzyme